MTTRYELDHATDNGIRHFIIHGPLPKGLNAEYGYPICDSMNRHHCISPEEDDANGQMVLRALNCHEPMLDVLSEIWRALTPGQQGCAGVCMDVATPVVLSYGLLGKLKAAINLAANAQLSAENKKLRLKLVDVEVE